MIKPNINIFEFDLLYQIFFEIKENLPFKITRLETKDIKTSNNGINKIIKQTKQMFKTFKKRIKCYNTNLLNYQS